VNDESSWQTISARDFSFAWTTTAQRVAFGEQFGACCAVNRAVDAATAEERCVCRVHNGINLQFSDVALDDIDLATVIFLRTWSFAHLFRFNASTL
jgi:hypothetical protein